MKRERGGDGVCGNMDMDVNVNVNVNVDWDKMMMMMMTMIDDWPFLWQTQSLSDDC